MTRTPLRTATAAFLLTALSLSGRVEAAPVIGPPSDLRVSIPPLGEAPTNFLLDTVRTQVIRASAALPDSDGVMPRPLRILVIGTGIRADLFPGQFQGSIIGSADALTDPLGHGTLAASVLLQVLPNAELTSFRIPLLGDGQLDLAAIAAGLKLGFLNRRSYDAILLAFPPHLALDPYAALSSEESPYGTGLDAVWQAILDNPYPRSQKIVGSDPSNTVVTGVPIFDDELRDELFAKASVTQRAPLERFVRRAKAWTQIDETLRDLDDNGVIVVAPSGDLPYRPHNDKGTNASVKVTGSVPVPPLPTAPPPVPAMPPQVPRPPRQVPVAVSQERTVESDEVQRSGAYPTCLGRSDQVVVGSDRVNTTFRTHCVEQEAAFTQSIYGLSARPDVFTVGASYVDRSETEVVNRVSPASANGPTLGLQLKPDVLAPSDVIGLVPRDAAIGAWTDAADHAASPTLDWGAPGVPATPCDGLSGPTGGDALCILQGSSQVAAAVAAANAAALAASTGASANPSQDDERIRETFRTSASTRVSVPRPTEGRPENSRLAYPWERGAGLVQGLRGAPSPASFPRSSDLGEYSCETFERTVEMTGPVTSVRFELGPALLATEDGATLGSRTPGVAYTAEIVDRDADPIRIRVRSPEELIQAGLYTGTLVVNEGAPDSGRFPLALVQSVCPDFKALYARDLHTSGSDGERTEDVTIALLPGIPVEAGPFGRAFKYLQEYAVDPTQQGIRFAVTCGGLGEGCDAAEPPEDCDEDGQTCEPAQEVGTATITAVPPGFWRYQVMTDYSVDGQNLGKVEPLGLKIGGHGPGAFHVGGTTVFIPSAGVCPDPGLGPIDTCVSTDTWRAAGGDVDPQTNFCTVKAADRTWNLYCGQARLTIPAAVVSRATHLVEYGDVLAQREVETCEIDIPKDATRWNLDAVAARAASCPTDAAPGWELQSGAPQCVPDSEGGGKSEDLTAVYRHTGNATSRSVTLPLSVITYRFALPSPNVFTTVGLNLQFKVTNAIVVARLAGRGDFLGDAAGNIVVINDGNVSAPGLEPHEGNSGAIHSEWTMLTSGSPAGALSLIVIPTIPAPGVHLSDPTFLDRSEVQFCAVGLEVVTFAKQAWSGPVGDGTELRITQRINNTPCPEPTQTACALSEQIAPLASQGGSSTRSRAVWRCDTRCSFREVGPEAEDALVAVHVPKPPPVRLADGPSAWTRTFTPQNTLEGVRRSEHEPPLAPPDDDLVKAAIGAYNPELGAAHFALLVPCELEPPQDLDVCTRFNRAVERGQVALGLPARMWVNGRVFNSAVAEDRALRAARFGLSWEIGPSASTFENPLKTKFDVSPFYEVRHGLTDAKPIGPAVLSVQPGQIADQLLIEVARQDGSIALVRASIAR